MIVSAVILDADMELGQIDIKFFAFDLAAIDSSGRLRKIIIDGLFRERGTMFIITERTAAPGTAAGYDCFPLVPFFADPPCQPA